MSTAAAPGTGGTEGHDRDATNAEDQNTAEIPAALAGRPGPYAEAAKHYGEIGWPCVIPVPYGQKFPPVAGLTGVGGEDTDAARIAELVESHCGWNIALRLPEYLVGVDIDVRNGGHETIADLVRRYGPLPATYFSSARDDGSGIFLFTVPTGLHWRDPGKGVDIIARGVRYAMAPPSLHPDPNLGTYRWRHSEHGDCPAPSPSRPARLPKPWVEFLTTSALRKTAPVEINAILPERDECEGPRSIADPVAYGRRALERGVGEIVASVEGSRNNTLNSVAFALGRLIGAGLLDEQTVREALSAAAIRVGLDTWEIERTLDSGIAAGIAEPIEWIKSEKLPPLDKPVGFVIGDGLPCQPVLPGMEPLTLLHEQLATWLDLPDFGHVDFALAVAVSAVADGEPLWGMLVGAGSSGKTEAVRLLDAVVDARVDELTTAALLSWSARKPPKPVGVLKRIPEPTALVTVADFSTVLASSDRGGRDQLFGDLRRVYDGSLTRDLGNAPEPLRWEGRLTLLAAVTPIIDAYSSHADALGPRWLYVRMTDVETDRRRRAAASRRGGQVEQRKAARELAKQAVEHGRAALPGVVLDDETCEQIGTFAVVAATARGAVPRSGYGKREMLGLPIVEEPHRLVSQLQLLVRSLLALDVDLADALALAARCAMDSVPADRLRVLRVLALGEPLAVNAIASEGHINRTVARYALEDLDALGIACCPVEDSVDDVRLLTSTPRDWQLTPEVGDLVAHAIRSLSPVTKRGGPTPIPPEMEGDG